MITNREKYKQEIENILIRRLRVDQDGHPFSCLGSCGNCIFEGDDSCTSKAAAWLDSEYVEPEVDWSKVKVDTPIYVKDYKKI